MEIVKIKRGPAMVRLFMQVDWWNKAFLITLLIAPLTVWISILMMGM